MINEKFKEILELRDENNNYIGGRCIGEILQTLLHNPTLGGFFEKYDIRFNDFRDSKESSLKVEEFITKYSMTESIVGPLEFINYLIAEDVSDNVLKDCILEKIQIEDKNPIEYFYEEFQKLINEFHNYNAIPFTKNLTMEILNNFTYIPIKGREEELESIHVQLNTEIKPNIVLTGDGGVGKTAIVEEYAYRHREDTTVFTLKTTDILKAGPEALKGVISAITSLHGNNILFIDEFHLLCKPENYIADHIKTELDRKSNFKVIVATTSHEYQMYIESDKALVRRFFPIPIKEISDEICVEVATNFCDRLSEIKKLCYSEDIIPFVIKTMAVEREQKLPDKVLSILDAAFARAFVHKKEEVTRELVAESMASRLNIPKEQLLGTMKEKLLKLSDNLKSVIIGQDKPIEDICRTIKSNSLRKRKNKPLAKFLFVGPTSVGKTEMSKQLAKFMFGSENNILTYDCAEMKQGFTVSDLLGAPPGYIGYEKGGRLINDIRRNPFSVIVFDEFEKAHEDVHDMMLAMLDEGRIIDKKGRIADVTNCIIIFTTNIGAGEIDNTTSSGDSASCGFNSDLEDDFTEDTLKKENIKQRIASYLKSTKDSLKPEFISRIDETIVFNKLNKDSVNEIVKLGLNKFTKDYSDEYDISFEIDDSIVEYISKKSGFNARRIEECINNRIGGPLGDALLQETIVSGDVVIIWAEEGRLKINSMSKEEYDMSKKN